MPDQAAIVPAAPDTLATSTPSTLQTLEQRAKTLPERLPWYGWLGVGVVGGLIIGKIVR